METAAEARARLGRRYNPKCADERIQIGAGIRKTKGQGQCVCIRLATLYHKTPTLWSIDRLTSTAPRADRELLVSATDSSHAACACGPCQSKQMLSFP